MNRTQKCAGCEFMKMFDYDKRIYYCDHEDRIDDIGKLSVGELPEGSPKWCPLGCDEQIFHSAYDPIFGFGNGRNDCIFTERPTECLWNPKWNVHTDIGDIIQMDTNTSLRDKDGKPIEIRVPEPEYMSDI